MKRKMSDDDKSYSIVGLTFLVSGVLFFFTNNSWGLALPFLIMGITFLVIGDAAKLFRKK